MHQNNINKITCTKITLIKKHYQNNINKKTLIDKIAFTKMAFVKSLLKTIYHMIIFLTKMFKIYHTLPTGNLSTYFDKFEWSSLFII